MRPGRIEIEIEELVLAGFSTTVDGEALGNALRLELERLVAARPSAVSGLPRLADQADLELKSSTDPATLGRRVARALHGGFDR